MRRAVAVRRQVTVVGPCMVGRGGDAPMAAPGGDVPGREAAFLQTHGAGMGREVLFLKPTARHSASRSAPHESGEEIRIFRTSAPPAL